MIKTLRSRGRLLVIDGPLVMGIVNITPDSFYENSRFGNTNSLLKAAEKMIHDGATILDIGGQSTRPGATLVPADKEWERIALPLAEIRKQFPDVWISVDTFYASVAEKAAEAGADIINDISAGDFDPKMLPFMASSKLIYVAMHKQGMPSHMQDQPYYENVVYEIADYFKNKLAQFQSVGIYDWILDPGFGFGKSIIHNYQILKHLRSFEIFDVPILVGMSRKGMIQKLLHVEATDALNGTTAANMAALERGASILRVHDVREAAQCIAIYKAIC